VLHLLALTYKSLFSSPVFLRAHNNQFWGLLPNGMTYLNKLREVYLNTNSLWSDLPPDVGMMEDLEDIRLGENRMYGTIPDSFYNLVKMKKIWFQDTFECSNVTDDCAASSVEGFEGSLQSEIGNMKDLSMLVINNNPLTGTLPAQLGNCEQLCKSPSFIVH
jgi:Leucine-rich repeat (LRR) protein